MSMITLVEQASAPATPTAGKVRVYVNSSGTLASVDDAGAVTTYSAGLTQEQVEDFVGALLQDSSSVNVTYNDAGNAITFDVIAGGVDHDALLNFVANEHINHASVSITAGTGLSGGGDITATRTLNIANTGVTAATYGSSSTSATIAVNAQGQITSASSTTITPAAIGAQPVDSDLTAIAGLAGTGLITRTGAGTATTRTITASTGITVTNGDGVSGNPAIAVSNVGTAGTYGSASQVPVITTNAQGQVSSVTNTAISVTSSAVSDFSEAVDDRVAALVVAGSGITATYNDPANTLTIASTITQYTDELAQDAVGSILADSASIDFTYNDAGNSITAAVLPAGVNHDALQNFVANEHIDHSTVSITAGTGLSGGGDITTSRTLNLANTAVTPGTYGSSTNIPVITVNAQGQITSASTSSAPASAWSDSGGLLTWADDTGKDAVIRQANDGGDSPFLRQVRSRGTIASPTSVLSGDKLGGHGYYGWNSGGANTNPSVEFSGFATENHTPTAQGAELSISTTPNGSATPTVRATIEAGGNWNIQSNRITNAANPINPQDYATKAYVDSGGSWQELVNTATLTNNSNVTTTEVTNLQIDVVAGRNYRIEAHMRFRSAAAGTGIGFTFNSSDGATGTIAATADIPIAGDGTASIYSGAITSLGDLVLGTAVPAANTDYLAVLVAQFTCTGSGTIAPFFRSETNGTTVTVQVGSNIIAREWA